MDFFEALFLKMLHMSITASYIIIVIIIIRLGIRKLPKVFSYLLWGIVGFRLVCPVSFSSILSIFNISLFDKNTSASGQGTLQYITPNIGTMQKTEVSVGINAINHVINQQLPAATPYSSINPMQVVLTITTIFWMIGIAVY